jgi:surface antigen
MLSTTRRAAAFAALLLALLLSSAQPTLAANPYVSWYQDWNGVWQSNCTWWAWQRWSQVHGEELPNWGNAGEWAANAAAYGYWVDANPEVGSIVMTWESPLGHVAFVERVDPANPATFLISEYGYAAGVEYHERWLTTDGSLLFIHPVPRESAPHDGDGTFPVESVDREAD